MRCSLCLFSLCGLVVCARTVTSSVTQGPANYELHRPVYHLTPAKGHNNDVNGLFFDARHGIYHAFVQYANITSGYPRGSPRRTGWYHFTSKVQISVETFVSCLAFTADVFMPRPLGRIWRTGKGLVFRQMDRMMVVKSRVAQAVPQSLQTGLPPSCGVTRSKRCRATGTTRCCGFGTRPAQTSHKAREHISHVMSPSFRMLQFGAKVRGVTASPMVRRFAKALVQRPKRSRQDHSCLTT